MIKMTVILNPFRSKGLEFTQAMEGLIKELRKAPGCLHYRFQRENKNEFSLDSDWNTKEELEDHFRSPLFSILLGAFHTCCEQPEVKVTDGSKTFGWEMIEAARKI